MFKPRDGFSEARRRKSGLEAYCRTCRAVKAHLSLEDNRERGKLAARRWRENNPEAIREIRLRGLYKRAGSTVGEVSLGRVLRKAGFVCHICGDPIEPHIKNVHFDHLIPLKVGGPHTEEHILPSHPACNVRKSGYMLQDFFGRWVLAALGGPDVWI